MPKLVAKSAGPQQLRPLRPNAGVEAWYHKQLTEMVAKMQGSLLWWLKAHYRRVEPDLAMDRNPATVMRNIMSRLTSRWRKQFDIFANEAAGRFVDRAFRDGDQTLRTRLKEGGFTVAFKPTMPVKNAYTAAVAENVALIKSIGEQHLSDVTGLVMRSVTAGRDLGSLTTELKDRYGITQRRAAFIAQDQNNKASAAIVRTRQQELGITQARWRHSSAGRVPRPEHVAADGKTYDVAKGMFLEGKWVWPGTEPRCRCYSVPIIPGFDD